MKGLSSSKQYSLGELHDKGINFSKSHVSGCLFNSKKFKRQKFLGGRKVFKPSSSPS